MPAPDIILSPGTTKDATNKILNGIVEIARIGLKLTVTNGSVAKSTGGGAQSSSDLTQKVRTSFIFGNGFNNKIVPEGTPDTLMPPFINELISKGLVDPIRSFLVTLYETTNIAGNLVDWFSDFVFYNNKTNTPLSLAQEFVARLWTDPTLFLDIISGAYDIAGAPAELRSALTWMKKERDAWVGGLRNNLVDEVYTKLMTNETSKPMVDGIIFTHSGAFQPFMKAIQKLKPDGQAFDVNTIINYEGPYWLSREDYIENPNLKRIINVWGTRFDAAPPIWSFDNVDFDGPSNIDNINIKVLNALHNDFSYDANDSTRWTPNPSADKRLEREINFKTSIFMQELYRAAKNEQSTPSDLTRFLENTGGVSQSANGTWVVDPLLLEYPLNYVY